MRCQNEPIDKWGAQQFFGQLKRSAVFLDSSKGFFLLCHPPPVSVLPYRVNQGLWTTLEETYYSKNLAHILYGFNC